jgi:hypothetical protein
LQDERERYVFFSFPHIATWRASWGVFSGQTGQAVAVHAARCKRYAAVA